MPAESRFVVISDTHGDKVDPDALAFVRDFVADWKPDRRLHLGDAFDFRWLRAGASDAEKWERVSDDIDAGLDLLAWYKPTDFVFGNHDDRVIRGIEEGNGATREACRRVLEDIHRVCASSRLYPYCVEKGVARIGHIAAHHGFHAGVYATRQHTLVYGDNLHGHTHTIDRATVPRMSDDGSTVNATGRAIGCLCGLRPDYARRRTATLRWQHGFAYGTVDRNGVATVWQIEKVGDRWVDEGPRARMSKGSSKRTSARKSSTRRRNRSG